MIHIKSFYNKIFIKYGLIFLILLTVIIVFLSLIKTFDYNLNNEKNNEIYRTILISGINIKKIIDNDNSIEYYEYDEETNEYSLLFKKYDDVQKFITKYNNDIDRISRQSFSDTAYSKMKVFFFGIMLVVLVILVILIVIFSVNFFYDIEKKISLYKLIGYRDEFIIKIVLNFMLSFYTVIYISSIIIGNMLIKIIISNYISNIMILSITELFFILFCILFIINLSFCKMIIKIKKTNPIKLIHSAN